MKTDVMLTDVNAHVDRFMSGLIKRNPGEKEFHQAVREVAETVMPFVLEHPEYQKRPYPGKTHRTRPGGDLPGLLGR